MKITNKFNIPQTFLNVLDRPTYSKGGANISATQLLNSPKIVALTKKYDDEIEQDASEMVWSIIGTAIHGVLEHGRDENHIVEQRLHADVDGWHISGAVDLQIINDGKVDIRDYKTTSVWSVMNHKIEWEWQLNIYAWLVEHATEKPVNSLGIVAILRDWKSREVGTKEGYPESPITEVEIPLWDYAEREAFIKERIKLHSAAEFAMETDGELGDCTPQEMWEKPTKWAVMKIGGVRAKGVYDTEDQAGAALEELGNGHEIQVRPGERTRCSGFCPVSKWCKQYQNYLIELNKEGIE